ncbi:MAG: tripartite tricarboxylate transporter TctB family protein [Pseudomonadota bacterium]
MPLDKWIAALFLVGSVIYGYAAFTYPLLPFERNMAFLPNTWPQVLAVLGAVLSLLILIARPEPADEEGRVLGRITRADLAGLKIGQAVLLVSAMIAYALLLRPFGFLGATVLFIVGTGLLLGERRVLVLILVAVLGAGLVWGLVDGLLGIFLRPLPWFLESTP